PPPPLVFKEPIFKSGPRKVDGIAAWLDKLEQGPPPPREFSETPLQRKKRLAAAAIAANEEKVAAEAESWNPKEDEKATKDAYNTLFVSRLAYETDESKLRSEMESVGPVNTVRIVRDTEGKSRGYGFVEFTNDADLKAAYRRFNGLVIDGRRILADVERGRTVPGWKPRRLGGGLGATRKALPKGTKNAVPPGGMASVANERAAARRRGPPMQRGGGGSTWP
ncbi:RNU1, partial [Symbiodinium sp. KB8]